MVSRPREIQEPLFGDADLASLFVGYRGAKVITTAVELDLFRSIELTNGSAADVAALSHSNPDRTTVILDALCALGILKKRDGHYGNTPFSLDRLHPAGARSMARNMRYQELLSEAYASLTTTVRRGRPVQMLPELLAKRPDFVSEYIRGMADIAERAASEVARALDLSDASELLDVGGGPGTFTLAFLKRQPRMRAALLDLPETLAVARGLLESLPERDRIRLVEGNYHEAVFDRGAFDIVLLSHVTHDEGEAENRALIRKAFGALKPGGRLVVHDFMLDAARTSPLFAALFSVHLITYTERGRVFTEEEYAGWLHEAGFEPPTRIAVCGNLPTATVALAARRP